MSDQPWRCGYCLRQPPYVQRHSVSPVCNRCRADLTAKGKKFCSGCKQALPLGRFAPISGKGGQRRSQCYKCRQPLTTASAKRWRQRYPERARAIVRAYKQRHPEKVRRWRHENYRRSVVRRWRQTIRG